MQEKLENVCIYNSKLIYHKQVRIQLDVDNESNSSDNSPSYSSTIFWWHHGIKNASNFTENPEKSGCLEKGKLEGYKYDMIKYNIADDVYYQISIQYQYFYNLWLTNTSLRQKRECRVSHFYYTCDYLVTTTIFIHSCTLVLNEKRPLAV